MEAGDPRSARTDHGEHEQFVGVGKDERDRERKGGGGGRGEREKERRWVSVEPLVDGEGWRLEISGLSELTTVSIFVGVWESEMGEGGGEREGGWGGGESSEAVQAEQVSHASGGRRGVEAGDSGSARTHRDEQSV